MQIVLPFPFKLKRRHAETVWANCLPMLFSIGFIGVGGFFLGVGFFPFKKSADASPQKSAKERKSQNSPDRGQSRKIRFSKFPGSGLKKI